MCFNLVVPLCQIVLSPVKTSRKLVEKLLFQHSQCLVGALLLWKTDFQIVQDGIHRIRAFHNNDFARSDIVFIPTLLKKIRTFPAAGSSRTRPTPQSGTLSCRTRSSLFIYFPLERLRLLRKSIFGNNSCVSFPDRHSGSQRRSMNMSW